MAGSYWYRFLQAECGFWAAEFRLSRQFRHRQVKMSAASGYDQEPQGQGQAEKGAHVRER
jgi:hypothetical protein